MSKNDHRRHEMSLKMTSNVGITLFTLIGIALYLLTFLSLAFTTPKPMAFWKLLVGSIGGSLFVGAVVVVVLRIFRFLLMVKKEKGNSHK